MAKGSETGGCLNCYAARFAARGLPGLNSPTTGEPFAVLRESGPRWTGRVELIESALYLPLRWRKPRNIFLDSMSDLFHENLTLTDVEKVFRVALSANWHTIQILTKRADVMAFRVPIVMNRIFGPHWRIPDHIWLGVSVEDQATADARIPLLLQTPAAVRFISAEPLLGPVDVKAWLSAGPARGSRGGLVERPAGTEPLDWVIVGGESGPGARPMQAEWAQSIRDQCQAAGVPFFFKQWGEWLPGDQDGAMTSHGQALNCGDEPIRLGKRAAGRLLDGREWDEMPEAKEAGSHAG